MSKRYEALHGGGGVLTIVTKVFPPSSCRYQTDSIDCCQLIWHSRVPLNHFVSNYASQIKF